MYRSSHRRCSLKKVFLKVLWISQENICVGVRKTSAWSCNFTKKETPTQMFSCEISNIFKNSYFEKHLRKTADKMICNKILLEKIRAVFRISIKLDSNVRKTGWKKMRFQLALNSTYSLTPPPLIHRRFKHHQRTKINKTMLSVFYPKFTISVLKST